MRFVFNILILLLIFPHSTYPQTIIEEGSVYGTWRQQNSPYFIEGEIKIPRGKKLIIEAGVKVIFKGHYKLIVNGILEAIGTEKDSIYFIPADTAQGWHGIKFIDAEDFSTLQYCVLMYGSATNPGEDKIILEEGDVPVELIDRINIEGGAISVFNSNPTISHCLILNNFANYRGGGIAIQFYSNPTIINCKISNNKADDGGGIFCGYYSNPIFINCFISENFGDNLGGGIAVYDYCSPIIDSCTIIDNICGYKGGGICFYTNSKPIVKNSVIKGNTAQIGGGIYIDEFYNLYREQVGKIDIKIINTRFEKNSAEYGGALWIRDTMGELIGVTICYNKAKITGGGIHVEYNPTFFKISPAIPSNIYLNFAGIMGNDLFRLGGGLPIYVPLDTFTVKHYSALNAEPVDKFPITLMNWKLEQVDSDLYINPDGDDSNSGLTSDDPLKSLSIALLKILADSVNPRTIYMSEGEYIFSETNDILMLDKHKYVSLKGKGLTEVILGTDRITVYIPWWITNWALLIYALIFLSILLVVWNVRSRRLKMNMELERERFEAQKLQEIDEIKTRFFTNISHEFRTPLTLIMGPAKKILSHSNDQNIKDDAKMIYRNAGKINRLVDELLELSKIESGKMRLQAAPKNLVSLVSNLVMSFQSFAERKNITLLFSADEKEITAYVDTEKFERIVSNLISNGLKFTAYGGRVSVIIRRTDGCAEISVVDTGIGIAKENLEKIFDRFFQIDASHTREQEGTGIGLALTKELIDLHKFKIEVNSEEGKGSTFKVIIPLGIEHLNPQEISGEIYQEETDEIISDLTYDETDFPEEERYIKTDIETLADHTIPVLLIVEDNYEVRKYIKSIIAEDYKIFEARNGKEGLEKTFRLMPDLIISDIMMPVMDGTEMCRQLKSDERTSHIPVIMLTAKATVYDKVAGLETGADDYLYKPFDEKELRARIRNLIEQRKRLHEHFRKSGLFEVDGKNINTLDRFFIEKVLEIITKNLSDSEFGIETLIDKLSVSKSVLYKKVSALTGCNPAELIRRFRLCKAEKLLAQKTGNISEIAYEVGFSNPAYFAECFKKEFGVSPSQYQSHGSGKG